MVDEFKSIRENLFKVLTGFSVNVTGSDNASEDEDEESVSGSDRSTSKDARAARALLAALFSKAGKGKDEIVQIVAREIGSAFAHMLKEPLSQLAKHQKLQISLEFVPKDKSPKTHSSIHSQQEELPKKSSSPSKKTSSPRFKAAKSPRS